MRVELYATLRILVNGVNIHALEELDTRLNSQDTLAIFPPIGGG